MNPTDLPDLSKPKFLRSNRRKTKNFRPNNRKKKSELFSRLFASERTQKFECTRLTASEGETSGATGVLLSVVLSAEALALAAPQPVVEAVHPKNRIRNCLIRNLDPEIFKFYRFFLVFPPFSYCFPRFPSPNLKKIQALVKFYVFLIQKIECITKLVGVICLGFSFMFLWCT